MDICHFFLNFAHMNKRYEDILTQAGIRVTANRLLVLRTIHEAMHGAFSFLDMKQKMPYMDESSVFRTITLFAEKDLLHNIDDGSGMAKFCLHRCANEQEHRRGHVHITCIKCHETICLEDVPIPMVPIPEGYEFREQEYIIKGICPKCRK